MALTEPQKKAFKIGGIVFLLIAVGSFAYGLTQLSFKREREKFEQTQVQLQQTMQVNQQVQQQVQEQKTEIQDMKQRMESLVDINRSLSSERNQSTVKVTYDPTTGKVLERLITKMEERSKSEEESHSKNTSEIAIEKTTTSTATTTTAVATTATTTTSLSATSTVATKDNIEVKPVGGGKKKEKRLAVGAAYHNQKVKPVVSYRAKAFGIGSIVSIGPAVTVGNDVAGLQGQVDILDLPRIGAGYGCSLKEGGKCGEMFSVGLKLDF